MTLQPTLTRFFACTLPIALFAFFLCVGCVTAPARLMVIQSTYTAPIVPKDPKGLHQVIVYFTLQNMGSESLAILRLRTSTSSTMTSEPEVPCELAAGKTIKVAMTAKTFDQPVTRHAWVETTNEMLELTVRVDPQKMRAAVESAKPSR